MELPAPLRQAVNEALAGVALGDLQKASQRLTQRYRAETRDGTLHLDGEAAALAYVTARLPATYAAVRAAMKYVAELVPDFQPESQMDIGAGPGTAMWAATDCWPSLLRADMLDASPAIRALGNRFSASMPSAEIAWHDFDISRDHLPERKADLITLAYVLDELATETRLRLVRDAWRQTRSLLLIVEPGTPAGWQRILIMRRLLIELGANIVAPCPHELDCPLNAPDWCHFSRRVARSSLHRQTKNAAVPWEDEKYIYLAASRGSPTEAARMRVIAPPREGSGKVALKLCCDDGEARERLVTRREGAFFKQAKRAEWGDVL